LLRVQIYPNIIAVVVDDGSSDGTSDMIASEFPDAVLLHGDSSLYWAGAMRMGIDQILKWCSPDDYLLLLNDDLIFSADLVQRLFEASLKYPAALIQAVESCLSDPDLIWQGGIRMNWWTAKHERLNHHRRISSFPPGHMQRSDYLTGRGVLVPTEAVRVAGNLSAAYKQGGDPEFSRRAAKHGYSLLVAYDLPVLSYTKGDNLNETATYVPSDFTKYFFSIRSSFRIANRWRDAMLMTNSPFQGFVFFLCDMVRVTGYFLRRLRLRAGAAL
jgi:GT2 family glycosyltransferase